MEGHSPTKPEDTPELPKGVKTATLWIANALIDQGVEFKDEVFGLSVLISLEDDAVFSLADFHTLQEGCASDDVVISFIEEAKTIRIAPVRSKMN
jgi:hypothetical protein